MPRIPNTSPQTFVILEAFLRTRNSWRHGYELSQECELKSGTLYPLLMRLAEQGLLESRWETDGDTQRPRHVYRLTASGAAFAREQRSVNSDTGRLKAARTTS